MSDRAVIEQRIRAENPTFPMSEGSLRWDVSPEEFPAWYEELIAGRVDWAIENEAQATTETAKRTRRQQFIAGMKQSRLDFAKLDDETMAVSQLEFRRILKRAVRGVIFLGEIAQDLGQIERDNGQ